MGIKYVVLFLILVFYMSFSIIFGILEGLFRVHVFWYSTTPPGQPWLIMWTWSLITPLISRGFLYLGIQKDVTMHVQTLDIIVFYSSDGFEGDLLLWVKMLLPGVNKRVYNLQSKQLIKLFSQVKIKHRCGCKSILKKN